MYLSDSSSHLGLGWVVINFISSFYCFTFPTAPQSPSLYHPSHPGLLLHVQTQYSVHPVLKWMRMNSFTNDYTNLHFVLLSCSVALLCFVSKTIMKVFIFNSHLIFAHLFSEDSRWAHLGSWTACHCCSCNSPWFL